MSMDPLPTARLHRTIALLRSRGARAFRRRATPSIQYAASSRTLTVPSTGASAIVMDEALEWSAVPVATTRLGHDSRSRHDDR